MLYTYIFLHSIVCNKLHYIILYIHTYSIVQKCITLQTPLSLLATFFVYLCIFVRFNSHLSLFFYSLFYTFFMPCMHNHVRFCHVNISLPCNMTWLLKSFESLKVSILKKNLIQWSHRQASWTKHTQTPFDRVFLSVSTRWVRHQVLI